MTTATEAPVSQQQTDFVQQLRKQTAAVRLVHSKFGVRRSLSREQIGTAAETFHAAGDFLSAGKKLINTRSEHYKACTGVISRARAYWRTMTVPYPIHGIRLIRKDLVPGFNQAMQGFKDELEAAVSRLQSHYVELVQEAKEQLGDLFRQTDYPADITQEFELWWEFPSVDPPDYLKQLNPALYEEQQQLVAARFEAAIAMAQDAFTAELQQMVSHLVERLSGADDGKQKIFRDSAVENLREFFQRFRSMNVGSNAQLDQLVDQAEAIIGGVDAADLRKDACLRTQLAQQMGTVKELLDQMVIEKPRRHIELPDEPGESEVKSQAQPTGGQAA